MRPRRCNAAGKNRRPLTVALALAVMLVPAAAQGAADAAPTETDGAAGTRPAPVTVELASSRPPCEPYGRPGSMSEMEREALEESYRRCYGTRSDDYSLQLVPGERVALYSSEPAPHVFIRLRRLWIDTQAIDEPVLAFQLGERNGTRLLQATAEGRQWQVELVPGRWMELDMSPFGNLWVKEVAEGSATGDAAATPAEPGP